MSTPFPIVFALYPNVTQLDFTGPHEVLSRLPGAQCVLASAAGGAMPCSGGLAFDTVPLADVGDCALLLVPGGYGCVAAMEDSAYLAELRRLAAQARYVASVCTGSLLLAAAGLLEGKRAACHWAWRDLLAEFDGVTPDAGRIVHDGRIWSGGGVTAGIDMALALMAEITDPTYAQSVQLSLEYAPAPPFDAGRPELADAAVLAAVSARLEASRAQRVGAARRAAAALAAVQL